jgi:hypothetical protein
MSTRIAERHRGPTVRDERELIRALLLAGRPDLATRLQDGSSGALLIPLSTGRGIEIGRMRRRGRARWVVAIPGPDGAQLREPTSLRAVAQAALSALRWAESRHRMDARR